MLLITARFPSECLTIRLKSPRVGGATSQYLIYLDKGFTSLPFGGEGGIRTLGPHNGVGSLAGSWFKPSHPPLHMAVCAGIEPAPLP